MLIRRFLLATCLVASPALCRGGGPAETLRIKALALQANGAVAGDLAPGDWKVTLGGGEAKVVTQRAPAEMGARPMKWAIVVLPVQTPEARKVALLSIACFMETLPPTDAILLVNRGKHGFECLTPGFTTRPSLWAAALDRLTNEMTARFEGDILTPFTLPPSPAGEAPEGMAPVQAFVARLRSLEVPRFADDVKSRRNILEDISPREMAGLTPAATGALDALGRMAEVLGQVPGDLEMVVFSRNELDDLASPIWEDAIMRSGARGSRQRRGNSFMSEGVTPQGTFTAGKENNDLLQVQLMVQTMTLARQRARDAFARSGVLLHTVAGTGTAYEGALREVVTATGGHAFHFTDSLPQVLPSLLGVWPQCYELTLEARPTVHPAKVEVKAERKGLSLVAPTLR